MDNPEFQKNKNDIPYREESNKIENKNENSIRERGGNQIN